MKAIDQLTKLQQYLEPLLDTFGPVDTILTSAIISYIEQIRTLLNRTSLSDRSQDDAILYTKCMLHAVYCLIHNNQDNKQLVNQLNKLTEGLQNKVMARLYEQSTKDNKLEDYQKKTLEGLQETTQLIETLYNEERK